MPPPPQFLLPHTTISIGQTIISSDTYTNYTATYHHRTSDTYHQLYRHIPSCLLPRTIISNDTYHQLYYHVAPFILSHTTVSATYHHLYCNVTSFQDDAVRNISQSPFPWFITTICNRLCIKEFFFPKTIHLYLLLCNATQKVEFVGPVFYYKNDQFVLFRLDKLELQTCRSCMAILKALL